MRSFFLSAVFLCGFTFWIPNAKAGPYEQGRIRLGLVLGGGSPDASVVLGASLGYFVVDGLELGFMGTHWFSADPSQSTLTPYTRYVLHFVDPVQPYLGGFCRHVFLGSGFPDQDRLGARAGIAFALGEHLFAELGLVYEAIVSECSGECSNSYPEAMLGASF